MIYDLAHGTLVPAGGTSVIGDDYSWAHHSDELEGLVNTANMPERLESYVVLALPSSAISTFCIDGIPAPLGGRETSRAVLYFVSENNAFGLLINSHVVTLRLVDGFRGPTCSRVIASMSHQPRCLTQFWLQPLLAQHSASCVDTTSLVSACQNILPLPVAWSLGHPGCPFLVSWSGGIANCAEARCLNSRMGIGIWRPGGRRGPRNSIRSRRQMDYGAGDILAFSRPDDLHAQPHPPEWGFLHLRLLLNSDAGSTACSARDDDVQEANNAAQETLVGLTDASDGTSYLPGWVSLISPPRRLRKIKRTMVQGSLP